jgi:solute carrier family 25 (mitochondrial adenine nucleotide translocator), member 4/5/6/31
MQYIFIYRSAYYGLFDSFKVFASNSGSSSGKDVKFGAALVIGQVSLFCTVLILFAHQMAALVAAMISYPLDTVRRRLMMQSGRERPEYTGTVDCFKVLQSKYKYKFSTEKMSKNNSNMESAGKLF